MNRTPQRIRGQVVPLTALGIFVFFAFLAIVLDFGRMFLVKQQLHNHCDAAALAGAQNLPNADESIDKAAQYYATNLQVDFQQDMWQSDTGDTSTFLIPPQPLKNWRNQDGDFVNVTTPYEDDKTRALHLDPDDVIEVISSRTIIHFLGRLIGHPTVRLRARAVAYVVCRGCGDDDDSGDDDGSGGDDDDDDDNDGGGSCVEESLVPIGYPVAEPAGWWPPPHTPTFVAPQEWQIGQRYGITHPDTGVQGNHYFLALGGYGAKILEENLKHGVQGRQCLGDVVETEPGLKNGPVEDGISFRIDQCPTATWDNFPADTCSRPIIIAIVDTSIDDYNGRSNVRIVGFAKFFVDSYEKTGNPHGDSKTIFGRFMGSTLDGTLVVQEGSGGGDDDTGGGGGGGEGGSEGTGGSAGSVQVALIK